MIDALLGTLRRKLFTVGQRLRLMARNAARGRRSDPHEFEVVVATTNWTVTGVNVFSANLVRGLNQAGGAAHVLMTEHDTALITLHEACMPRPAEVPFESLPVRRRDGWGVHWGATVRWLEDAAPCVYLPNHDWRHSTVCPVLSDQVVIVGVVHSDDPLHYDHVRRLGRYWNVIVAVSKAVAERTAQLCPEIADRIVTIPIGVSVPAECPRRAASDGALRMIYHGILKQHQKRVLDLPRIVQNALDLGVPVVLDIAGAGPDEDALRSACAELVARGAIRFLGVTSPADTAALLQQHDVYLLASEFEGMPNALIEAMGHGCVPIVSRMTSGIPELIRDGENGFLVPIGDYAAFAARLQLLRGDPDRCRRMSRAAHATVKLGGFRVEDMVDAYQRVFADAWNKVRSGAFVRPRGTLSPPPTAVAGISVFPVELPHLEPDVGAFASIEDAEDYLLERARIDSGTRRRDVLRARPSISLDGLPVFVATPVWIRNGVNAWTEDLVRGLRAARIDARILLTEESTELVTIGDPRLARPTDLPFEELALTGSDNWGARWGAMIRTLEAAAPCIYLPTYDWRHACVIPALSNRVTVVGTLHDANALYTEQAQRLEPFWDALVAPSHPIARHFRQQLPGIASRLQIVPHGLDFPASASTRPRTSAGARSFVIIGTAGQDCDWLAQTVALLGKGIAASRIVVVDAPASCSARLLSLGAELLVGANRQQWLDACRRCDFVVASSWGVHLRPLWFEAIGNGCVPIWCGANPIDDLPIEGGVSGIVAEGPGGAIPIEQIRALVDSPSRYLQVSACAHQLACRASLRIDQMIEIYREMFERLLRSGGQRRGQPGPILPPPAYVAGQSIFPVELSVSSTLGRFPAADDARRFLEESRSSSAHSGASARLIL
jgi:glycosyltransferase involved in cell wall biosynthesis